MIVCGISTGFPVLFPTSGQITHVLLTRAPLYSGSCPPFLARLACVRHAASVDSEPGSNSQDNLMRLICISVGPTVCLTFRPFGLTLRAGSLRNVAFATSLTTVRSPHAKSSRLKPIRLKDLNCLYAFYFQRTIHGLKPAGYGTLAPNLASKKPPDFAWRSFQRVTLSN